MLVIGALLLVPAAFGRSWWLFQEGPLPPGGGVGLLELESCDQGRCRSVSHTKLVDDTPPDESENEPRVFLWSGRVTFAADLLAAAAAAFLVALLSMDDQARARRMRPLAGTMAALALLASVVFLMARPNYLVDGYPHGRAIYLHFVGLALVAFGEQLGLRVELRVGPRRLRDLARGDQRQRERRERSLEHDLAGEPDHEPFAQAARRGAAHPTRTSAATRSGPTIAASLRSLSRPRRRRRRCPWRRAARSVRA